MKFSVNDQSVKSERQAVSLAKELAKNSKDVYVRFYRPTDGQHGFLNPDGYGITGKNWAKNN
jgi:hypothetical protein